MNRATPIAILFALNELACSGAVLVEETRPADAVPSSNADTQAPDVAEPDATTDAAPDAVSSPDVDAAPVAPAWCLPVNEAGLACHIDPLPTCVFEWGYRPATAYACMGAAAPVPTDCKWVTDTSPSWCGVVVYCCATAADQ